jgi:protein-disulfide isomerase
MTDSTNTDPISSTTPAPGDLPRRKKKAPRQEAHWPWFVWGAAVGVIFGFLLFVAVQSYAGWIPEWVRDRVRTDLAAGRSGTAADSGATSAGVVAVRDANTLGPANAPVTVVEFSDFRCGYCRRAFSSTNQQIISTYVNTGQVRFVYKHLAILGTESIQAAVASECAADQGKFWDYHDQLFTYQVNGGTLSRESLGQTAQQLGLDMNRFNTCLDNQETISRVQADLDEAQSLGLTGTPSYLIDGKPIIGAQPFQTLAQAIDAELR